MNPRCKDSATRVFFPALLLSLCGAAKAGTPFTYQGELRDGAALANGVYDLRFELFSSSVAGIQIGPTLCFDDVTITDGRIALPMDFGLAFGSDQRYLAVYARADAGTAAVCADPEGFEQVGPRAALEAVPAALYAPSALDATNATHATTAATAPATQKLAGQPASFYTNAANLTGALPSSALAGAYGSPVSLTSAANTLSGNGQGLTGVTVAAAASATSADTATTASNSAKLNGQPASYYLNAANMTGTLIQNFFAGGPCTNPLSFTNPLNSFNGDGTALTGMNASQLGFGRLPAARLGGNYASAVNLSNTSNQFAGNGAKVLVSAANFLTGTLDVSETPKLSTSVGNTTWSQAGWTYAGTAFTNFSNIVHTRTTDIGGTAVLVWTISGYTDAANTQFWVAPFVDGVQQGISIPFDINTPFVHQHAFGCVTIPNLAAGSHTVSVRVARRTDSFGNGNFRSETSDILSWSIFVVR